LITSLRQGKEVIGV